MAFFFKMPRLPTRMRPDQEKHILSTLPNTLLTIWAATTFIRRPISNGDSHPLMGKHGLSALFINQYVYICKIKFDVAYIYHIFIIE